MELLKDRIRQQGQNLGNGILKVDGFINHQVDPMLMDACGQEFAKIFANIGATKILTAEISGIAPAVATGKYMELPVVYARKSKPVTMPDQVFLTLAPSHTKGRMVELIVSPEYLSGGRKGVDYRRLPGKWSHHFGARPSGKYRRCHARRHRRFSRKAV